VIERLRASHPGEGVVAVTHNFVILATLCRALNLPLGEFRRVRQGLATKTVLDIGERGCRLLQLNDNAHLIAAGVADDLG
jgi:probable phosphoglycerate mutase